MRLSDLDNMDTEMKKHRFRIIGELGRKWDKVKQTNGFDDIVRIFQNRYRINVSHNMIGIAFYGLLHTKSLEFIVAMRGELDKKLDKHGRF